MRHAALLLTAAALFAADPVLLQDDFAQLDPAWKIAKGKWEITGGALKGVELPADKHAAVLRRPVAYHDAVIEFRVKLEGAKTAHLSLNSRQGHVCRVVFDSEGFSLRKDKTNAKSADRPVALGRQGVALGGGQWHRVTVTVRGRVLSAQVDGGPVLSGEHEGIDVDKVDVGFPVTGDSASFDDLRVTRI